MCLLRLLPARGLYCNTGFLTSSFSLVFWQTQNYQWACSCSTCTSVRQSSKWVKINQKMNNPVNPIKWFMLMEDASETHSHSLPADTPCRCGHSHRLCESAACTIMLYLLTHSLTHTSHTHHECEWWVMWWNMCDLGMQNHFSRETNRFSVWHLALRKALAKLACARYLTVYIVLLSLWF